MPLLTAQKHGLGTNTPFNFYHFPEEHKENWSAFWESNDGDLDKILDFAKKAGIERPAEWVDSLHRFLFDVFSGNPKLLKHASKGTFGTFLNKVVENHKKEPKDRNWYVVRGVTPDSFVAMLERAAEIKDTQHCVSFINARLKDMGFYLYSEFILSKTSEKSKIKSVASRLMRQSRNIIEDVTGQSVLAHAEPGLNVSHKLFPGEVLEIVGSGELDSEKFIAVVDEASRIGFVFDHWNLEYV